MKMCTLFNQIVLTVPISRIKTLRVYIFLLIVNTILRLNIGWKINLYVPLFLTIRIKYHIWKLILNCLIFSYKLQNLFYCIDIFEFLLRLFHNCLLITGWEGTLNYKSHWFPRFTKCALLLVGL